MFVARLSTVVRRPRIVVGGAQTCKSVNLISQPANNSSVVLSRSRQSNAISNAASIAIIIVTATIFLSAIYLDNKFYSKSYSSKWYRGEIDGLRAVAVVAVILHHFKVPGFSGGFTGVDVFFVISGYLITSIQLKNLEKKTFAVIDFWSKRVRRLFWALAVVLLLLMFVGNYIVLKDNGDYAGLLSQVKAVQLFGANFYYAINLDNYFYDALTVPLLHCWSLAVEEQFYFIYPLILRYVWRYSDEHAEGQGKYILSVVCFAICVPSIMMSVLWSGMVEGPNSIPGTAIFGMSRGSFAFYLLPARAWEMALGALCALFLDCEKSTEGASSWQSSKFSLAWTALGVIFSTFYFFSPSTVYPGSAALLPCLATTVFLVSTSNECLHRSASSALAWHPIAFVGRISYSLYVWHWPIYVLIAYSSDVGKNLDNSLITLGICMSFAAASFSYFLVEQTMRDPQVVPGRIFWPVTICVLYIP